MAKMDKKWVILCSTAVAAVYATGYYSTEAQALKLDMQDHSQVSLLIKADKSMVSLKNNNKTDLNQSSVAPSNNNQTKGNQSIIASSNNNQTKGNQSIVASSKNNQTKGSQSIVASSKNNQIKGSQSSSVSLKNNQTKGSQSRVASSKSNQTKGSQSRVATSKNNQIKGSQSSVVSSKSNQTKGNTSSVASSKNNQTKGNQSSVASSNNAQPKLIYKEGTFKGMGENRRGSIQVAVTIKNDKITDVEISDFGMHYSESDIVGLPHEVLLRQSPQVDNVSGATYSTQAFEDAVLEALYQARNS
ncbi:MAG: FMN-binding protein [Bacillota bacterium]|nr:FMN-binding protein [Bacillota bacterium]